jgi:hypothetical protein
VGDFQVATGGGFWVAIRATGGSEKLKYVTGVSSLGSLIRFVHLDFH